MATNFYGGRSPKQEELYGFNSLIYPNGKKPTRHSGTLGGNSIFNPLDLKNRTANKRSFSALNYAPINDKNYSAIYGHSSDPRKRNLPSLLNQPSNRQRPIGIANDGVKQTGTGTDNTPPNQKNNLLNYLISPQGKGMAQGLLEASGYSDTPVTFGQAIGMV